MMGIAFRLAINGASIPPWGSLFPVTWLMRLSLLLTNPIIGQTVPLLSRIVVSTILSMWLWIALILLIHNVLIVVWILNVLNMLSTLLSTIPDWVTGMSKIFLRLIHTFEINEEILDIWVIKFLSLIELFLWVLLSCVLRVHLILLSISMAFLTWWPPLVLLLAWVFVLDLLRLFSVGLDDLSPVKEIFDVVMH